MIIKADTELGNKAKIYNKDGVLIDLFIFEYNTETKEAKFYDTITNNQGERRLAMTDLVMKGTRMERSFIILTEILNDSYAEIDGVRV